MDKKAIESVGQHLKSINANIRKVMFKELENYDVTMHQFYVLKNIRMHPGINLTSLSAHMCLNKSSVSLMIDKLVEDGYVIRTINDADRRNIHIHLTQEGISLVEQVSPIFRDVLSMLLKSLSDKELHGIEENLALLSKTMDAAMINYDKREVKS